MNGVLVLDKPTRMSSAAAVDHVKKRLGIRRAGHGGTLDPIATGVLAICIGEACKLSTYMLADDKAYDADLVLGSETDTLDRTGAVTATRSADHVTREAIEAVLAARRGEHDQLPPIYSAIKQAGVRNYQRARAGEGEEIERTPRRVRIDRLELLEFTPATASSPPHLRVAIACSKGTYVRSLIADIGSDLGCGAHMTELRRTQSGVFTIDQAYDLDRMDNVRLIEMTAATTLPRVTVAPEWLPKIRVGLQVPPEVFGVPPEMYERFLLLGPAGELLSVAHVEGKKVVYDRVFAP